MSSLIFMKILESAPQRYDRGIRFLFLGKLDKAYDCLVSPIQKGYKVLDIGCGTGALSFKAAQKGALVRGMDINPQMLEQAQKKAKTLGLKDRTEFKEKGVSELDEEETASYDAVTSGLCFSELSEDEIHFALKQIKRILKENGLLLIADEVMPSGIFRRIIHWVIKAPLLIITYVLTQTSTRAVKDLPQKIADSGFQIEKIKFNKLQDFMELKARKEEET
ncbi:MAG TPA: corrinoid protein-associated methyltransferase CpaM [Acidobacteriota bacterium]|nr:corrinoid protein-associated methyltransferase CpaM [Acidobacteriota bacterium]